MRLSLGAVNVRTGESVYFDSTTAHDRREPRHGERRAAARLPAGRDRRRVLLGRRHHVEHAAAVRRAGLPHERADRAGRPVQRPGRAAAEPRPGAGARRRTSSSRARRASRWTRSARSRRCAARWPTCSPSCRPSCAPIRRSRSWKSASRRGPVSLIHLSQPARHEVVRLQGLRVLARDRRRALAGRATTTCSRSLQAPGRLQRHRPGQRRARLRPASARTHRQEDHSMNESRSQEARLRDAAHQPGVSAGPVPLRQSRVLHHHLPHRPRRAARP